MRHFRIARLLTLAVLAGTVVADAPASRAALPALLATRQTMFSIPFRIDRADRPTQEPVEVRLYVSTDQGKNWHLSCRVNPAEKRFLFQGNGDGEYWFQVRTVDRSGQVQPTGGDTPGLRVLIDTAPPQLELQATRGEAGQITTRWQMTELHPKVGSLKMQYRTGADQPWQSVAVSRPESTASDPTQTGEVTWWPQAGSPRVEIRAEVSDVAGNSAVTHAHITDDPASPTDPAPSLSPNPGVATETVERPPDGSVAIKIHPAVRNRYTPPGDGHGEPPSSSLPAGERPQMVNTRVFELDYHVDSVGPSGIGQVELWGTRDGGKVWSSFGLDDDNQSPLVVTVDEEGTYGFRVVVQNGVGLGEPPPESGELPDIWIGVDLTKPAARILSTDQGTGQQAGQFIIRWEATDSQLAARPVSLYFGDTAGGPWSVIATGLENTGSYAWSVDARLPERIYLRLEARDEAGNIGVFETPEPISLDPIRPSVHIRNVRPVTDSAWQQPQQDRYH